MNMNTFNGNACKVFMKRFLSLLACWSTNILQHTTELKEVDSRQETWIVSRCHNFYYIFIELPMEAAQEPPWWRNGAVFFLYFMEIVFESYTQYKKPLSKAHCSSIPFNVLLIKAAQAKQYNAWEKTRSQKARNRT